MPLRSSCRIATSRSVLPRRRRRRHSGTGLDSWSILRTGVRRKGAHVDGHAKDLLGAPNQHAADRRDVPVVAAPADGNVPQRGITVIGWVGVNPANPGAEQRDPGMRGVDPAQFKQARRWVGFEVAAYIAGRQADGSQAGDEEVGEVLADTPSVLWKSARGVETVVAVGSNRKSDCRRVMRSDRASKIGRARVNDSSA